MKRLSFYIFCLAYGLRTLAFAQTEIEGQNLGSEKIEEPAKRTPFGFTTNANFVGTTTISNRGKGDHVKFARGDHVRFAEADVEFSGIFYYVPEYTEGANLALGYTETYIGWNGNPWFRQEHFHTVTAEIAGFTKRIENWFWRSQFTINFDTSKFSAQYMFYDWIFWGRHELYKDVGLHFGFYLQTGMRMDRIYPILGADWQISPSWKLNLVYPVNISLEYQLTKRWSLSVAARTFSSRHRTGPNENNRKSLLRYQNTGGEFMVAYDKGSLAANVHIGSTFGSGYLRISNKYNHNARHYYLNSSVYAGAEIEVSF